MKAEEQGLEARVSSKHVALRGLCHALHRAILPRKKSKRSTA